MPAVGYYRNGVDIGSYFGAKGASTAAATGYKKNGVDLNQLLLARADGVDIGFNTGYLVNGNDLRNIFGAPAGNTPLPINGNTYSHAYTIPSGNSGTATIGFRIISGTTWQVYWADPTSSATVLASGSVPSGATTVKYTWGTYSIPSGDGDGGGATTNGAASATAISGNPSATYQTASWGSSSGSKGRSYPFTIDFYNSSSVDISTTNITLIAETDGSV